MAVRFDRDSKGIADILKSQGVKAEVHAIAEAVAQSVRSSHRDAEEVVVDDYTTDRAASSVTIRDSRGAEWQARDGVLTKAASSVGLEVRAK